MSDIVERLREGCGCNFPETTCMAESECSDAFEAADEITRLRNELHLAQEWSARVIAGQEQDIAEITRLRAKVEKLKAALATARADALEEASRVADGIWWQGHGNLATEPYAAAAQAGNEIAAAIRALTEKEETP